MVYQGVYRLGRISNVMSGLSKVVLLDTVTVSLLSPFASRCISNVAVGLGAVLTTLSAGVCLVGIVFALLA